MNDNFFLDDEAGSHSISLVAEVESKNEEIDLSKLGDEVPILALREMVIFPGVFTPIPIGRKASLRVVKQAEKDNTFIAAFCQKDSSVEFPTQSDLHSIGTLARVLKIIELPDNNVTAIVQGINTCDLISVGQQVPFLMGKISLRPNSNIPPKEDVEFGALIEACKKLTVRYIRLSDNIPDNIADGINSADDPIILMNTICSSIPFSTNDRLSLLKIDDFSKRLYQLSTYLSKEISS